MRQNFASALSPLPPVLYAQPTIPKDVACYRILKPCYLDDVFCVEGEVITWPHEPNKEMEPLNDLAKAATRAFFDKLDEAGRAVAAARSTKYVPLRRPVEDDIALNSAESRRVEIVRGDGGVPIMGARKIPAAQKLSAGVVKEQPVKKLGAKDANAAGDSVG